MIEHCPFCSINTVGEHSPECPNFQPPAFLDAPIHEPGTREPMPFTEPLVLKTQLLLTSIRNKEIHEEPDRGDYPTVGWQVHSTELSTVGIPVPEHIFYVVWIRHVPAKAN